MLIKRHPPTENQIARLGKHEWHVPRLFELSKNLPVLDIPLQGMNMYYTYGPLTLRELAAHMVAVNEASLEYPIILDEDGEIMDGRHRLIKAIISERETIKAVRFRENPTPCNYSD